MLTEKTSRRIKCEGRVAGQSLYTDHRVPIRSKLLHANRMRTESLATAPLRRRETVFGRQSQKAPNCLRAVLPPSRDWKPTYSPPQNRGYSANARKSPVAYDCVVVDAARIEPVSTSNSLLAGNLAGNFLKRGPPTTILASKAQAGSIAYERIPCSTEQGIFSLEQGIFSREQGILRVDGPHPSR